MIVPVHEPRFSDQDRSDPGFRKPLERTLESHIISFHVQKTCRQQVDSWLGALSRRSTELLKSPRQPNVIIKIRLKAQFRTVVTVLYSQST